MQIGDFCFLGCIHPQIIDALKFKVLVQSSKFKVEGLVEEYGF